jgi:hypothetical protein
MLSLRRLKPSACHPDNAVSLYPKNPFRDRPLEPSDERWRWHPKTPHWAKQLDLSSNMHERVLLMRQNLELLPKNRLARATLLFLLLVPTCHAIRCKERAIQEQEFERLGSARTIQVNVRMIAATHRDLAAMIREQEFREDLFYRFNVFPIEIPPLRERREDIPSLVNHFVAKFARRMGKDISFISRDAMEALTNAPWKGNIRELGNFMERCVILTQGNELNVPHLDMKDSTGRRVVPVASSFREAERRVIIDALSDASGRIAGKGGAAERLGLKRTTLQNKMRRLSIGRSDYSADQYTNRIADPQATS